MNSNLELFWSKVLSEDHAQMIQAVESLLSEERQAVITHLKRMANETGWSEEQRRRAQDALDILGKDTE